MPYDPERVAECGAWLERVRADLDAATILLGAASPRPDSALFHCQQAVEKLDPSLAPLTLQAEDLTQFAWVFRYPGEPELPSPGEAKDALKLARAAFEAILGRLPKEMGS